MPRFECKQGGSNKFWVIEKSPGAVLIFYWGRIGTLGQTISKSYSSALRRDNEYGKLIAAKLKKGYKFVDTYPSEKAQLKPILVAAKAQELKKTVKKAKKKKATPKKKLQKKIWVPATNIPALPVGTPVKIVWSKRHEDSEPPYCGIGQGIAIKLKKGSLVGTAQLEFDPSSDCCLGHYHYKIQFPKKAWNIPDDAIYVEVDASDTTPQQIEPIEEIKKGRGWDLFLDEEE